MAVMGLQNTVLNLMSHVATVASKPAAFTRRSALAVSYSEVSFFSTSTAIRLKCLS